jgi:hypothetical protein
VTADGLIALGLRAGEAVRFRRRDNERWSQGRLVAIETDGSLRLVDKKGAIVSLPITRIEVRRGKSSWEPASARAARTEQLGLL